MALRLPFQIPCAKANSVIRRTQNVCSRFRSLSVDKLKESITCRNSRRTLNFSAQRRSQSNPVVSTFGVYSNFQNTHKKYSTSVDEDDFDEELPEEVEEAAVEQSDLQVDDEFAADLEQYHMMDMVPQVNKGGRPYDVIEQHRKRYYEKMANSPHLQPSNMRPFGSTDSIIIDVNVKHKDVTYPIFNKFDGYKGIIAKSEFSDEGNKLGQREYSTIEHKKVNPGHIMPLKITKLVSRAEQSLTVRPSLEETAPREPEERMPEPSGDIEKCNLLINEFKKLNPECTIQKRQIPPRSSEEKEALDSALKFAETYRSKYQLNETGAQDETLHNKNAMEMAGNDQNFSKVAEDSNTGAIKKIENLESKAKAFMTSKPFQLATNTKERKKFSFGPIKQAVQQSSTKDDEEIKVVQARKINLLQSSALPEDGYLQDEKVNSRTRLTSPWPSYSEAVKSLKALVSPGAMSYSKNAVIRPTISKNANAKNMHTKHNAKVTHRSNTNEHRNIFAPCPTLDLYSSTQPRRHFSESKLSTASNNHEVPAAPGASSVPRNPSSFNRFSSVQRSASLDDFSSLQNLFQDKTVRINSSKSCSITDVHLLTKQNFQTTPMGLPQLEPSSFLNPFEASLLGPSKRLYSTKDYFEELKREGTVMVKLKRLKKRRDYIEQERYDDPDVCAPECQPRADDGLKIRMKRLPKWEPELIGTDKGKKGTAPKLRRLPSMPFYDRVDPIPCEPIYDCPERADDGLEVIPKRLPYLEPSSQCECVDTTINLISPRVKRLPRMPKYEPKKVCPDPPCHKQYRADENLRVKKKKLPKLVQPSCACIIPPALRDCPKLKRLPKVHYEDPVRSEMCPTEKCPERADDGLVVRQKKLPSLLPRSRYRKFSTLAFQPPRRNYSTQDMFKEMENEGTVMVELKRLKKREDYKEQERSYDSGECPVGDDCRRADEGLVVKEKKLPKMEAKCICKGEQIKGTSPKLRRLPKKPFYERVDYVCEIKEVCPERADQGLKVVPKKLPYMPPSPCACIAPDVNPVSPKLKRLPKMLKYDPKRPCEIVCEDCCRADKDYKVERKKLPVLKAKCHCVEAPQLRDAPKLKRLPKIRTEDPVRCIPCTVNCGCPERSDEGLEVRPKKLPSIIPKPKFRPVVIPKPKCRRFSTSAFRIPRSHFSTKDMFKEMENEGTVMVELKRLKKREGYVEQERSYDLSECPDGEYCRRADEGLEVKEKKLPKLEAKCICKIESIKGTSPKLRRLPSMPFYERVDEVCEIKEVCPERADEGLKVVPKTLPYMPPSPCACIIPEVNPTSPKLKRLPKMPKYDPKRPCEAICEGCCRADKEYKVERKKLPKLEAKCHCVENPPLRDAPKLKRLPKFHFEEPERCVPCTVDCGCPERADEGLEVLPKELPILEPKCGCIDPEVDGYSPELKRLPKMPKYEPPRDCYTTPCEEAPYRADEGLEILPKQLPILEAKCICKVEENKGISPKLRRLPSMPFYDRVDEVCEIKEVCPERADEGLKVVPKTLPYMPPSPCACIIPEVNPTSPKLKRLPKMPKYDPKRPCEAICEGCCRADKEYIVERKKLPKLEAKCHCVDNPPLRDAPKLKRLPKFHFEEPVRCVPCTVDCGCPERADEGLEVLPKELPILEPKCGCIEPEVDGYSPELKRLPKMPKYEPPRDCYTTPCEEAPYRADQGLEILPKQLPILEAKCICKVEENKGISPKLRRLPSMPFYDRVDEVCEIKEVCPERADEGLKVVPKTLPYMPPSPCACIIPEINPTSPKLKRLPKMPKYDPKRPCEAICEGCCRADKEYIVERKKLPKLEAKCHCVDNPPLRDAPKLKRLPKFHFEEPVRCVPCTVDCGCPERADEGLEVLPKELPILEPKCGCIEPEVDGYSPELKRLPKMPKYEPPRDCYTTPCEEAPYRADQGLEILPKQLPILEAKCICKVEENKGISPKLRRLPSMPFYDRVDEVCEIKEVCPERADEGLQVVPKTLPYMPPSPCACIIPEVNPTSPKLKRLPKMPKYDPKRPCEAICEGCCRADKEYLVERKKLPKLEAKCHCVENPPLRDAPKLKRLPKFHFEEPVRCIPCTVDCGCPERADEGLEVRPKKLPSILPKPKYKPSFVPKPKCRSFSTMFTGRRYISTSAPLLADHPCQKKVEKKVICKKFILGNCPKKARETCETLRKEAQQCTKRNAPYKAYTDCNVFDEGQGITECPNKNDYLQPKLPILGHIPPFEFPKNDMVEIDIDKEDQCIRNKLGLKASSNTFDCTTFGKRKERLTVREYLMTEAQKACAEGRLPPGENEEGKSVKDKISCNTTKSCGKNERGKESTKGGDKTSGKKTKVAKRESKSSVPSPKKDKKRKQAKQKSKEAKPKDLKEKCDKTETEKTKIDKEAKASTKGKLISCKSKSDGCEKKGESKQDEPKEEDRSACIKAKTALVEKKKPKKKPEKKPEKEAKTPKKKSDGDSRCGSKKEKKPKAAKAKDECVQAADKKKAGKKKATFTPPSKVKKAKSSDEKCKSKAVEKKAAKKKSTKKKPTKKVVKKAAKRKPTKKVVKKTAKKTETKAPGKAKAKAATKAKKKPTKKVAVNRRKGKTAIAKKTKTSGKSKVAYTVTGKCKDIKVKPQPCPSKPPKKQSLWEKIMSFFKARPNCPTAEDLKKKRLRDDAEKAAKRAGLYLCTKKPGDAKKKPQTIKKCSPAALEKQKMMKTEKTKSKCSQSKPKPKPKSEKCPVKTKPKPKPKPKQELPKVIKPRCVKTTTSSTGKCKMPGKCPVFKLENCPPRVCRPCVEKATSSKTCCPIPPPYASFSECKPPFAEKRKTECEEAAKRSKFTTAKALLKYLTELGKQAKEETENKQKFQRRKFSTYAGYRGVRGLSQRRNYSSRSKRFNPFSVLDDAALEDSVKKELAQKIMIAIQQAVELDEKVVHHWLYRKLQNMYRNNEFLANISFKTNYIPSRENILENACYQWENLPKDQEIYQAQSKEGSADLAYEEAEKKKTEDLMRQLNEFLDSNGDN